MLKSLHLQNFKSFADASATFSPFTLVVGANASGKSNLLEALKFLKGLGHGWSVREVLEGKREGGQLLWRGVRGGARAAVRGGADRFSLASEWMYDDDAYSHSLTTDGYRVIEERGNNFKATAGPGDKLSLDVSTKDGSPPPAVSELIRPDSHAVVGIGSWRVTSQLAGLQFFDFDPNTMRNYVPVGGPSQSLANDGSNLSAVLYDLCTKGGKQQELVDWLQELCAPEVADLRFSKASNETDVLLEIVENDGTRVDARSMSDGTLRFLALLVAIWTSTGTVIIEDLDHGLHPSRVGLLVEAIESWSLDLSSRMNSKGRQVIATTHSPALLEALSEDSLHDALLIRRGKDEVGSKILRVGSIPHLKEVLEQRGVGYLLTTNWLERAS